MYNLNFDDVLIKPRASTSISSRSEVELVGTYKFGHKQWTGIPIFIANMHSIATLEMAKAASKHKIVTCLSKFIDYTELDFYLNDGLDGNYLALTFGMDKTPEQIKTICDQFPEIAFICLDVANGGMTKFSDFCCEVANSINKITIAGNIANEHTAFTLLRNGVDIVKFGIGGGSHCLTRTKTGVGFPQFGLNVRMNEFYDYKEHIMSDGGCVTPGDVCKVFGTGTSFVMLGGMFAGHDECDGELIEENGKKYKISYGMSSNRAVSTHYNQSAEYKTSEGSVKKIPYRGKVDDTILDILGGIRSMCSYTNTRKLSQLIYGPTEFVQTTTHRNQSLDRFDIGD